MNAIYEKRIKIPGDTLYQKVEFVVVVSLCSMIALPALAGNVSLGRTNKKYIN